ncbi:MAG: DUF6850 family outer membrane beta-barrel protein [Ignavibacteria bacterium]
MKKLVLIILIFIFQLSFAQNERIASLGNPTIAFSDFDLDLNLYDFGNNYAWLIEDHKFDVLYIRPSVNFQSGDYRRYFDAEKISLYRLSFDGTKILKDGAFRGYVTYEIESRKNVNRALSRSPYNGVPFRMTDTTLGDFLYNGPRVGFQYAFLPFKDFYLGFDLNYQIVDGLKSIYSRAKSLWRNIDGSINFAYKFSNDFVVGAKLTSLDNKESIEAKSEDLFDAEIFNYRGDTYAFKRRSQTVEQTYREKLIRYDLSTIFSPTENLTIGVKGNYLNSNLKTQFPYGTLKEYEEGHSVFEDYGTTLKIHYSPIKNLLVGFEGIYDNYSSWSRVSESSLMIWKWNIQTFTIGSGVSYKFNSIPLITVIELKTGKVKSDSSKYIDNYFSNYSEPFYSSVLGFEYELFKKIFLRAGYSFNWLGFDVVRGGRDISMNEISLGIGIYNLKTIQIDYYLSYEIQANSLSQKNKFLNSQLSIKIFNY